MYITGSLTKSIAHPTQDFGRIPKSKSLMIHHNVELVCTDHRRFGWYFILMQIIRKPNSNLPTRDLRPPPNKHGLTMSGYELVTHPIDIYQHVCTGHSVRSECGSIFQRSAQTGQVIAAWPANSVRWQVVPETLCDRPGTGRYVTDEVLACRYHCQRFTHGRARHGWEQW